MFSFFQCFCILIINSPRNNSIMIRILLFLYDLLKIISKVGRNGLFQHQTRWNLCTRVTENRKTSTQVAQNLTVTKSYINACDEAEEKYILIFSEMGQLQECIELYNSQILKYRDRPHQKPSNWYLPYLKFSKNAVKLNQMFNAKIRIFSWYSKILKW